MSPASTAPNAKEQTSIQNITSASDPTHLTINVKIVIYYKKTWKTGYIFLETNWKYYYNTKRQGNSYNVTPMIIF